MNLEFFKCLFIAVVTHRFVKLVGGVIILLLVLVVLVDWVVMPLYTRHGQEMEMPNITKMRYEDAKRALELEDFEIVTEEERYSGEIPAGYVIEQSPQPHAKVKNGRRVYVVVSRGEKRVLMPNLMERSQRDAELLLSKNRLIPGVISYEYSNIHPEGVVIDQSVPPNAEVTINTRVHLTISVGTEPTEFVVPHLEGRSFDDALRRIKQAGLRVGQLSYTVVPDLLPETVIRQSIEANTIVEKETVIDLELSTLPRNN